MKKQKKDQTQFSAPTEELEAIKTRALLSHDVRSAISDIIGALQLLDTSQLGEANKRHLGRIGASAGLLFRLIDQSEPMPSFLLADEQTRGFLLAELLDDLKNRWSDRAKDNRVELVFLCNFDPELTLDCNQLPLERLLSNLLDNAIKFSRSGVVILSVRNIARDIQIDVQDDGPGFSQTALDQLFTFGGRPEDSPVPGSGLGLFICKKMADQLGGKISVRNTDTGALVTARLPCHSAAPPPIDIGVACSVVPPKQQLAGVRVLLAEDNMTNQLVATQMLQSLGAIVSVANDGVEALAMIETQPFDLAVLDIEMPRKSGLELIRDIRSRGDEVGDMPIVALTAYVMQDHCERILAAGADGIISKPLININDFGNTLHRLMHRGGVASKGLTDSLGADAGAEQPDGQKQSKSIAPVDDYVFGMLYKSIGPAAFSELQVKLLQDLGNVSEELQSAIKSQDCAKVRKASHVLISLAGAVGAHDLQECAQRLHDATKAGDLDPMAQSAQQSLALLDELTQFLASPGSLEAGCAND